MSNVYPFIAKAGISANENLELFVEHARSNLTVYGDDLNFDENIWDITNSVEIKGKSALSMTILFGTKAIGISDKSRDIEPFKGDFLRVAKAYIRYMQAMRPTTAFAGRIAVLRVVSEVLNGKSTTLIDPNDLNQIASLIKERYSKELAYRYGQQLEMFYGLLKDKMLVKQAFTWRNNIPRPVGEGRIGREADKKREEKMPSDAGLEALPKIFRTTNLNSRDELVVSMCALLCCSPDRISEVLELPYDCEYNGIDKKGNPSYGLRWWPAKGAAPYLKMMTSSMVDVAKEAIQRIKVITEPAREIARWYESNPKCLYLPIKHEHYRKKEYLTINDIAEIRGCKTQSVINLFSTKKYKPFIVDIDYVEKSYKTISSNGKRIKFKDFEALMIGELPKYFPYYSKSSKLKFSEMLLLARVDEFHGNRPTSPFHFEPVSIGFFNNAIGERIGVDGHKSIFERNGYTEPDGSKISITSHQFRHYLNTLANAGGMSALEIAKWSGRMDLGQNDTYDHVSGKEMIKLIRDAIGDAEKSLGPIAMYKNKILIPRDEFGRLVIPTAHTTDIGYCVHDYGMSPCETHRDCLNCNEMVCVKGDQRGTKNIKQALDESTLLLESAQLELDAETYGANRWIDYHRENHERLEQLNKILDDPNVKEGTVIQLFRPKNQLLNNVKRIGNA